MIGDAVRQLTVNTGLADIEPSIRFKDTFGKTVAESKVFGGYKVTE